ncbi:MAG TPA: DUF6682 family protein [Lysobacter sp.]|nr:DUF6682 family protein [Lysobacter sp.]
MNRNELIAAVRFATGDHGTPPLFSDEDLTRLLNEAEQEACIRARLLRDQTTEEVVQIQLEDGVRQYRVHATVFDVLTVTLRREGCRPRKLLRATPDEMLAYTIAHPDADRAPCAFYFLEDSAANSGGLLTFDTALAEADGYQVTLEVQRLPLYPMENEDDEPEIPYRHHPALVDWVLFKCYSSRDIEADAPDRAARHKQEFVDHFGERPSAYVQQRQQRHRAPVVRAQRW